MINWERIAELLTYKWYSENKLPIWKDGREYNYIWVGYATFNSGAAIPNNLRFTRKGLCFAHNEIYIDPETEKLHLSILRHGEINKHVALFEVWSELTEDEKTNFMSETLGQK